MLKNSRIIRDIILNFDILAEQYSFVINKVFYTYKQLSCMTSRVSKQLLSVDDSVLGIFMHDDFRVYSSIISILLQNKGYVVINPKNPMDRNELIVRQASIKTILCFSSFDIDMANQLGSTSLLIDNIGYELEESDNVFEICNWNNSSTAYILFTSGSTGTPKGVNITHDNLQAFLESFFSIGFTMDSSDNALQMFDLTFDVSVAMLLCPLICGACIYTVPFDKVKYIEIVKILNMYRITVLCLVPSVLSYLRPYFSELQFVNVKECILTAEASYHDLVHDWKQCIPNSNIWNLYGPTEATIWCLKYLLDKNTLNEVHNGMIPIGTNMLNVDSIIIDEDNNVISAIDEKGELLIGGNQVTNGYINDQERNITAFLILESEGVKTRYYKTGDIVYKNHSGNLMYCGRLDHQVKVQGYRIELNEIEYFAKLNSRTSNAVCIIVGKENQELILFIEQMIDSEAEVIANMKQKLPSYMLPRKVISMDLLPINASSKIDRIALARTYYDKF